MQITDWVNANQGVIELVGLFLVIPFAILSERILFARRKREQRKDLRQMLLKELWINLNLVAQIEESYGANFRDVQGLHLPHFAPRTEILERYFGVEFLDSLSECEKDTLVETYAQLCSFQREFLHWKSLMLTTSLASDNAVYAAVSSSLVAYIEPLMRNMLRLWVDMVYELGSQSTFPQLQELSKLIEHEIKGRKWIRSSYKATYYRDEKWENVERFDIQLCWINDWPDCPRKVIEIRNIVAIHDSWKK